MDCKLCEAFKIMESSEKEKIKLLKNVYMEGCVNGAKSILNSLLKLLEINTEMTPEDIKDAFATLLKK